MASKDLKKAEQFYSSIGFTINEDYSNEKMLGLFVGSNRVVVNLFPEEIFEGFIGGEELNASSNKTLLSIGMTSEKEIDELVSLVKKSDGKIYAEPSPKDGWMYGFGFADPDGHMWNAVYMDISKFSPNKK